IDSFGGDGARQLLWIRGKSLFGQDFSEAAAIAIPDGLKLQSSKLTQSAQLVQLQISFQAAQGHSYTFAKFVSAARDGWGDVDRVSEQAEQARNDGFASLLTAHEAAWHNIWKSDIVIDGNDELQRVVHADLFSLLENSTPDTGWAIQGMGLSPIYGGHV